MSTPASSSRWTIASGPEYEAACGALHLRPWALTSAPASGSRWTISLCPPDEALQRIAVLALLRVGVCSSFEQLLDDSVVALA
jgi:hypothetical protein